MLETYRTFIAIELPSDIRKRITEHIARLRHEFPDVRASWSREENLHLTLKFLGDIAVSRIADLSKATAEAARSVNPFELTVGDCGTFPPQGQPKVLWIGTTPGAQAFVKAGAQASCLHVLHEVIDDECAEAGFEREARPYHPHLTIARLRTRGGSRSLAAAHKEFGFANQTFIASELVVFRSELRSEGSKHTIISRHEFT